MAKVSLIIFLSVCFLLEPLQSAVQLAEAVEYADCISAER